MFTPYYPPHVGGVEFYAQELTKQLKESGHHVTIVTSENFAEKSTHDASITYPIWEIVPNFPIPKIWSKDFRNALKKLSPNNYDVVLGHTRFFLSSLLAVFYAKKNHIPYIHIEHGSSFVVAGKWLIPKVALVYDYTFGKFVLHQASAVIAISQSVKDFLQKLTPSLKPVVIYRGMEVIADRREIKNNNKIPQFTFVGRITRSKGIFELIESLASLQNKEWHCNIVGDGEDKRRAEYMASKLGIAHKISFLGRLSSSQIPTILSETDIFLHPSYTEGLPTAVLEAALIGVPIIATDVGGTKEISHLIHLIPPKNHDILTKKIDHVLSNISDEKSSAYNNRVEIQNKFSWEKYVHEFEAVLKKHQLPS